jgi:hypothetical protein
MSPEKEPDYFSLGDLRRASWQGPVEYRAQDRERYGVASAMPAMRARSAKRRRLTLLREERRADAAGDPRRKVDPHPARPDERAYNTSG